MPLRGGKAALRAEWRATDLCASALVQRKLAVES